MPSTQIPLKQRCNKKIRRKEISEEIANHTPPNYLQIHEILTLSSQNLIQLRETSTSIPIKIHTSEFILLPSTGRNKIKMSHKNCIF